jgi:hypothetical protein
MPIINLKNKFFVISIFLVLIVFIAGWFFWQKTNNQPIPSAKKAEQENLEKKPVDKAVKEENISDLLRQKNIIYEQAVEKGDIKKCEELSDINDKNLCYKYVALKVLQTGICEKVTDNKIKGDCVNEVYFALCKSQKNISSYEKISDNNLKQACRDYIIAGDNSLEDCEKLSIGFKDACINNYYFNQAFEKKDISYCQKLPNEAWEECFREILNENEDLNLCKQMAGDAQNLCNNIIGYKLAIDKIDAKYCQYIIDDTKRNDCIKEVDNVSDNDNDGLSNSAELIYKILMVMVLPMAMK